VDASSVSSFKNRLDTYRNDIWTFKASLLSSQPITLQEQVQVTRNTTVNTLTITE